METHGEAELLECRLRTEDLVKLQSLFLEEEEREISLGREEFAARAWAAVGRGSQEEYGRLFDSVDVSREGRLDWTRLTTFLLLKLCEQEDQERAATVPRWRAPRTLPSPHREPIQGVVLLRNPSRYLSLSKDGVLGLWCEELGLIKSLRLSNDTVKPKDLWATAIVVLPNVHKVAVAFTSKELCFYDLLSKQEFSCQYKVQGLRHTPIALHYWFNREDPDKAVLSVGDVGGQVSVMSFRTALISLFERPSGSGAVDQEATTTLIQWAELTQDQHSCCYTSTHTAHANSWVRRVRFLGPLEAIVSCTWNKQGGLVLAWKETRGSPLRVTNFNTHTGISDLDYHPALNLIATAGLNNHVYLWNPYVTSKPVGVLRGHMSSVLAVQFVLRKKQLLSFSKDKVLRLWDVSSQLCVQRVAGVFPKTGPECQTRLLLREEHGHLLLSFNGQLLVLEARTEPGKRLTSHHSPVTCVLYNALFRQVISSDTSSTVTCWLMDTGQKVKQFTRCHGDAEISTMALDATQTRLFTAGTDGLVKVWDFNGHCHHRLNAGGDRAADITQVLVLKRTVLVVGWERIITVFRPAVFSKFFVQPCEWLGGVQHRDDVLCAAFRPPQTLVTGSYDGEITVWNNSTENALRKLRRRRPDGRQGLPSKSDGAALRANQSAVAGGQPSAPSAPSGSWLPPAGGEGDPEEDGQAITKLFFLERSKAVTAAGGADLVSCGMSGLVRFWNTLHCSLVGEFVAHKRSGSIILTVDGSGKYLVTADVHGGVKVWDVQDYCLLRPADEEPRLAPPTPRLPPPPLLARLKPHLDCVMHLETCVHGDQLFLLSTSIDCTVALSYLPGHCVGIFGQEEHWHLGRVERTLLPNKVQDEKVVAAAEEEEDDVGEMTPASPLTPQGHHSAESLGAQGSALLGEEVIMGEEVEHGREVAGADKSVAGAMVDGRGASEPGPALPKLTNNKSVAGAMPNTRRPQASSRLSSTSSVGTFSELALGELQSVEDLDKPDFVANPHLYFGRMWDSKTPSPPPPTPPKQPTLKASFDERSLFPKEVLQRVEGVSGLPARSQLARGGKRNAGHGHSRRHKLGVTGAFKSK
ncbi:WD repeat-containing protein 49-like [Engraulis encrasicolus]|uniref:WD repeat-containing protein 49-like n=1 Tax=Engraulis encrasicolus TaxID=184585 RepID=UPI002FD24A0B